MPGSRLEQSLVWSQISLWLQLLSLSSSFELALTADLLLIYGSPLFRMWKCWKRFMFRLSAEQAVEKRDWIRHLGFRPRSGLHRWWCVGSGSWCLWNFETRLPRLWSDLVRCQSSKTGWTTSFASCLSQCGAHCSPAPCLSVRFLWASDSTIPVAFFWAPSAARLSQAQCYWWWSRSLTTALDSHSSSGSTTCSWSRWALGSLPACSVVSGLGQRSWAT